MFLIVLDRIIIIFNNCIWWFLYKLINEIEYFVVEKYLSGFIYGDKIIFWVFQDSVKKIEWKNCEYLYISAIKIDNQKNHLEDN